jgi:hypothetical protein
VQLLGCIAGTILRMGKATDALASRWKHGSLFYLQHNLLQQHLTKSQFW